MPETTVTYIATRDTDRAQATDEDRAMAHMRYYSGDSLTDARSALYCALQSEATWLARPDYRSARSLRRAAELLDAADTVHELTPETGKAWSAARVVAAGIVWQITRTELKRNPIG